MTAESLAVAARLLGQSSEDRNLFIKYIRYFQVKQNSVTTGSSKFPMVPQQILNGAIEFPQIWKMKMIEHTLINNHAFKCRPPQVHFLSFDVLSTSVHWEQ